MHRRDLGLEEAMSECLLIHVPKFVGSYHTVALWNKAKPTLARAPFHVLAWRAISGLFVLECGALGYSRSHCPPRVPFDVLVTRALLLSSCDTRIHFTRGP